MTKNPYTVLGVKTSASAEEIKKAFRKLCRDNHPDKGGTEDMMAELNEAYAILSDPEKRKDFDRKHSWSNEFNLYASVLGRPTVAQNFGKKPVSRTAVNGADIHLKVNIPLSVYLNGCHSMPVQFERVSICLECDGTGAKRAVKCGNCAGIGKARDPNTHRLRKCPKCGGTGINVLEKCPCCNGGERRRMVNLDLVYLPGMTETKVTGKGNSGRYGGCNGNLLVRFNPALPEGCFIDGNVLVVEGPEIYPEDLILGKWIDLQLGDTKLRTHIPPNSPSSDVETLAASGLKMRVKCKLIGSKTSAEMAAYEYLRTMHTTQKT